MTTPTPADAIRAAINALPPNATGGQIAATVLRVAADKILPRPITGDQSRRADRDRLLRLQFLEPANELAGNPAPAESREALAEAREESQSAARDGIEPGPYSEHDLRQMWNARSAENWDDLESHERLAVAQIQAIKADRRRAEPIAWCRSDDFADADTKRQSFSGWREQHSDCDMALYGVPVPAFTMPATAPGDLAQWLEDHATHLQRMEEIGALPEGELAPMLADAAALIRQHEANLATARHALRRLRQWGRLSGGGYSADVVLGVVDWIDEGMTGSLPPLPPYIASRDTATEPAPSAPALPPAIAYDGGDGVRIWTAGPERTDWVVRRDAGGYWERLHIDGRWWAEPWHQDADEASMVTSHWPTAAAAWEALQRSRAAEGVEG